MRVKRKAGYGMTGLLLAGSGIKSFRGERDSLMGCGMKTGNHTLHADCVSNQAGSR